MSQLARDRVQQGRDAYRRHAWHEAFDSLREADSEATISPEGLRQLAESAWFAGDPDAAIEARERAHAGYLAQGDKCHAAEMALQLALDHFERLETAIGNGWLGRARRLLEQTPSECAAHGWQAASLAYLALRMADWRRAVEWTEAAEPPVSGMSQSSNRSPVHSNDGSSRDS